MNRIGPSLKTYTSLLFNHKIRKKTFSSLVVKVMFLLLFLFGPAAGYFQNFSIKKVSQYAQSRGDLVNFSKGWEYKWGARYPETVKNSLQEESESPHATWKPITSPINPPGRDHRQILFLRNKIPNGNWKTPAILIDGRGILLTFRAFVDGELIYGFGEEHLSGISSHLIPIDEKHLGRTIVFRVFSNYSNIGIRGRIIVGSCGNLIQYTVNKDIAGLVVGLLIILIGLIDFVSYRENIKTTGVIPMFGVLAVALGLYTVNVTTLKDFIFNAPAFWLNVYIAAMTLMPIGAIGFVWQTFRAQPGNFLHRLWQAHVVYAVLGQAAFIMSLYSLLPLSIGTFMINVLRWILLLEMILILGIIIQDAVWKKNIQARIYLVGFVPIICAGTHDALVGLGKIDSSASYVPYALMIFILSLELVRRRRFIRIQNRLKNYTGQLELQSQEKEELLRDLHDGVGGLVTNIKFLSEMGRSSSSTIEKEEALANISSLSSESLIEIGNIMQSLDADEAGWSALLVKYRQLGNKLIKSRGLRFKMQTNIRENQKPPDRILFLNLLRIYKEALTNITKHSKATMVHVILTIKKNRLNLSIQDDGIGLEGNETPGRGVLNMKVRARKMGGEMTIESKRGTVVTLEIPISDSIPDIHD